MIENLSDILIITDVDGTLMRAEKGISSENLDAIKRFTGKGGHFTVSTGRAIDVARELLKDIPINTPSVHINGGYFYDWQNNPWKTVGYADLRNGVWEITYSPCEKIKEKA